MPTVFTTGDNNFGTAKLIVDSNAGSGNYTSLTAALAAASSGQTIFIRPGTYVESPSVPGGVNISAYTSDGTTPNVTIQGTLSFSGSGLVNSISGINLVANGAGNAINYTATNSSLYLTNCYITLNTQGQTGINLNGSGSNIYVSYCQSDSSTTLVTPYAVSAGQILSYHNRFYNSGGSLTASTCSSGKFFMSHGEFNYPITISGNGSMDMKHLDNRLGPITYTTSTANNNIWFCDIEVTSVVPAISIGAGATVTITGTRINTRNINAISGLGTIIYGVIEFISGSTISVVTKIPLSTSEGTVTSVSGTAGQIDSTGGSAPVISIDPGYVGQTSITTLGTIATGTWQGTVITGTYGGTGVNNGAKTITLGGNLTTSGAFASTFTMTNTTNVTFPTSGTLATTSQLPSLPLSLANGGTNANLTASNGGIFYSTGSAGAILSGTATANQILMSGSSTTPAWSTAIYPATVVQNQLMWGATSTTISFLSSVNQAVLGTTSGAPAWKGMALNGGLLIGSAAGDPSVTTLTQGTGLTITNGANSITIALTTPVSLANGGTNASLTASNGGIFYSTGSAGAILGGTATANQILMSGASTTPAWSTATYPATATSTGTILRADGTNWSATTATYPNTSGSSGNILASTGSNFTSQSPAGLGASMVLIQSQTASSSTVLTFTTNTNLYSTYKFVFSGIQPGTNAADLWCQISNNGGSSYISTGYKSGINVATYNTATFSNMNTTSAFICSGNETSGSANDTLNGVLYVGNCNVGADAYAYGNGSYFDSGSSNPTMGIFGGIAGSTGTNSFQFLMSSGNIAAGTITCYGLRSS